MASLSLGLYRTDRSAALTTVLFLLLAREGSEARLPSTEPGCFIICAQYRYFDVPPALAALPGLLNLGPFVWLLSRARGVRVASALSGFLGLVQVAIPAVLLFLAADKVIAGGVSYFRADLWLFVAMWLLAYLIWLASLFVWCAFGVFVHSLPGKFRALGLLVISVPVSVGVGSLIASFTPYLHLITLAAPPVALWLCYRALTRERST